MGKTFNNTDAAVCGCIAIAEFIFLIAYFVIQNARLHRKIISMGRLIPSVHMIVSGGISTSHVVQVQPRPPTAAPPPGFYNSEDYPPPYSPPGNKF